MVSSQIDRVKSLSSVVTPRPMTNRKGKLHFRVPLINPDPQEVGRISVIISLAKRGSYTDFSG